MFKLDYSKMIFLDAEDLAEGGILRGYESLWEVLSQYVAEPAQIQEVFGDDHRTYIVRYGEQEDVVYSPALPNDEGQSWGRATYVFFKIINDQLSNSEHRLYAINGGNDLGGMFLSQAECEVATRSLPRKEDWPYLPTSEHPWYGQYHD